MNLICGSGLVYAASPPVRMPMDASVAAGRRQFWSKDFLSSCYNCKKMLDGLDIYMYRYINDGFLGLILVVNHLFGIV
ncbi:hypothetical protein OIU77_030008 [Salix suchowensis]|uniref:FLZ-type domain-containing protein n=1 Tax=Salix suchowensis TaxID=1278906 RepID=A0ABQ9BAH4_9ROSI|nr:hypothetical protein OIU77_030008 [Salix suchowensis]